MASTALAIQNPKLPFLRAPNRQLSIPFVPRFILSLRPLSASLSLQNPSPKPLVINKPNPNPNLINNPDPLLSASTRTLTTLFALAKLVLSRLITAAAAAAPTVSMSSFSGAGAMFFAALRDRPRGNLNTPLTVVASGMAKWLDIYSGVLMIRVLLSWFPNIPWDRQPLSAIRDLCDPYLNLFRNIIPPVFDTLDVSPLLAFAVLGALGSILNSTR